MKEEGTLIQMASEIGGLKQGFKDLSKKIDTHLKDHRTDKIMQWVILIVQVIVILFLGFKGA